MLSGRNFSAEVLPDILNDPRVGLKRCFFLREKQNNMFQNTLFETIANLGERGMVFTCFLRFGIGRGLCALPHRVKRCLSVSKCTTDGQGLASSFFGVRNLPTWHFRGLVPQKGLQYHIACFKAAWWDQSLDLKLPPARPLLVRAK